MQTILADGIEFVILFPDLFKPLTESEFDCLVESIRKFGVQNPVLVESYSNNGIIDGINRVRAYARLEAEGADLSGLPVSMIEAVMSPEKIEELAISLNIDRRHLSKAEVKEARERRVQRVAELRAEGKSLRAIAEEVGVNEKQVRKDLASTADQSAPETVQGRDGRTYPARREKPAPIPTPPTPTPPEPPEPAATVVVRIDDQPQPPAWKQTLDLALSQLCGTFDTLPGPPDEIADALEEAANRLLTKAAALRSGR